MKTVPSYKLLLIQAMSYLTAETRYIQAIFYVSVEIQVMF